MDDEFKSRFNGEIEVHGNRVAPSSSAAAAYSSSISDPHALRCYSTSHISSISQAGAIPREAKLKKGKSASGSKGGWILSDPELQRKKRVAGYKAFALEGKMKGSLRKSFRWVKDLVNGSW
ncbi:uncharacterized protein A4U43_C01F23950 [Asparagus officinalis]|uniref:DUF3511 domain-containing protein n=1 Tax=Asparagus officinalis TaxID=4686 RepID=A0A5P1FSA8_ASPOF|nr:uncharacterized protein A4U43_C01F23950 [Asparagus officinalis]